MTQRERHGVAPWVEEGDPLQEGSRGIFFVATVSWAKLPVVFIGLKRKDCVETPNEQGGGWEPAPT